jgi:hypothetical protein
MKRQSFFLHISLLLSLIYFSLLIHCYFIIDAEIDGVRKEKERLTAATVIFPQKDSQRIGSSGIKRNSITFILIFLSYSITCLACERNVKEMQRYNRHMPLISCKKK